MTANQLGAARHALHARHLSPEAFCREFDHLLNISIRELQRLSVRLKS